jgi:hypothetical protein
MPRKAAPPAEGTDIPEPRRSGRLASTTSAVVDTAKDAVKTVKKATAASKKRSGDVDEDEDVKEAKKVSNRCGHTVPSSLDVIP